MKNGNQRKKCNLGLSADVPMLSDDEFEQVMEALSGFKQECYRLANTSGCSFDDAMTKVPSGQKALDV